MGDSSDSEEFYDAEEFTPVKGSKRSSICKNANASAKDITTADREKNTVPPINKTEAVPLQPPGDVLTEETPPDDRTTVKSVVSGRRRFEELRRCMAAEEEDEPEPADRQDLVLEQPFKIRSHDTMSLQSMTSLGRIGRILSGAAESHPNIREAALPREPSSGSDDPLPADRSQNVLVMAEPDVIASTKANSLRASRLGAAIVAVSGARQDRQDRAPGPVAPPRKKKRSKTGPQSSVDGDNISVCTADTDEFPPSVGRRDKPHLDALNVEDDMPLQGGAGLSLPSPASTIESLTREFQDSLELSTSRYTLDASFVSAAASLNATADGRQGSAMDIHHTAKGSPTVRGDAPERAHGSLGSHARRSNSDSGGGAGAGGAGARRRSAGDEPAPALASRIAAAQAAARDGLTDLEILEQVTVLNLDTGERVPLSVAEHKLPQCINPLSLHIMRLTSEYIARQHDDEHARETDEESESVCVGGAEDETKEAKRENTDRQTTAIRRKTEKIKRFFGSTVKKTVDAAKSLAQEVSHARHKEDVADIADDVRGETNIKLKASNSHKGPYDFDGCVRHVQEMSEHTGAVWCCKFSDCGRLLATAGQDKLLRTWVTRDARHLFQAMRTKYNAEKKSSPTPSQESLGPTVGGPLGGPPEAELPPGAPFWPTPFCVYSGHTSDLLDVSWSKNYFLLSSSMDKTVRLWHISLGECLCCFQHIDFVTAIVFHPRDDRYFLSGSLDGKIRLWNIPDKKVAVWNEVDGKTKLITAANFCQNGKFAVVGTYDGRCIFYTTDQLKYHTQIDVRSTRGKNSTGRKISGIEPMPNDDKILVTSNDSRIRLYDLRDLNLSCKYKGYVNVSSQIKASFSHDGKYIVSGSENQCIYIWKTYHDYSKFTSVRRDRNDYWEGIKAHNVVVTCAVFAPNPDSLLRAVAQREEDARIAAAGEDPDLVDDVKPVDSGMVASSQTGHVLVSADFNGCIKVFVHKAKTKHSSLPASALA